ncbi:hypothetical protein DPMN_013682 [Dreissena polymorpha]|uniref:Uncharacterized protein n=1 Tax=Dreissena polymorpha TaxID=45954 RepID=A0A9D4N4N3_DREPO|nr:hypothetical protein DPMN_013682 [Dreissena polymorpha]
MVSINIPDLFPPEQNALIHIITICVTTININRKKNVRALSLSLSLSQKQKKARENCLPKKESVEPDIVLPPLFYYIKLQNYSDPCNTIKHLTISNSTTERAHGNRNQGRLWNRGALFGNDDDDEEGEEDDDNDDDNVDDFYDVDDDDKEREKKEMMMWWCVPTRRSDSDALGAFKLDALTLMRSERSNTTL